MYYVCPVTPWILRNSGDLSNSLRESGGWLVFETVRWSVPTSGMVVGWRLGVCIVVDWGREGAFDVGFFGICFGIPVDLGIRLGRAVVGLLACLLWSSDFEG